MTVTSILFDSHLSLVFNCRFSRSFDNGWLVFSMDFTFGLDAIPNT